jgi:phospholipid/cholesterol/gamma-HCH transport system substrate-binding protein
MNNKNLLVGLFVVSGLALFAVGIALIGNRHEAFARHVDFYTEFVNLAGLSKGAKVQVAGMDAGEVLDIGVPDSPSSRFRVKLRIDEKLHGLVRTDSVASIGTEGVVGDTFLLIRPGSVHASTAAPLATLPTKEPLEISELLEGGKGLINDADGTLRVVSGKLTMAIDGVTTTVSNMNDVVVGLKQGHGPAGMLLQDKVLATQIQQTLTNAQQATASLGHASGQADALISDLQSRHLPQKADETMNTVKSATSSLDESARQIQQTVAETTLPDEQGVSAGTNIRESLSNANATTANMADATEALKHNFFFRGFFRHRGYYNLADLSPDQYRKDQLFMKPTNYRAWLSADELFQNKPNGSEQLTLGGKTLLDAALTRYGDSFVESPIVIEGYKGGDDPSSQLALSRSRAILVREYLKSHYQLDPRNLGIVSMKTSAPDGVGHSTWDGICVVILKGALR